jgi:hypothetical protein
LFLDGWRNPRTPRRQPKLLKTGGNIHPTQLASDSATFDPLPARDTPGSPLPFIGPGKVVGQRASRSGFPIVELDGRSGTAFLDQALAAQQIQKVRAQFGSRLRIERNAYPSDNRVIRLDGRPKLL